MNEQRAQAGWVPFVTVVVAMVLTIWPLPDWAEPFRPEWMALTVIYWCMALPRRFNVGISWGLGIVLDVLRGTLFGAHALALTLLSFALMKWHLQVRNFPVGQQSLAIGALLFLYEFALFWINGIVGTPVALLWQLAPLPLSILLWPWIFNLLRHLRRRYAVN